MTRRHFRKSLERISGIATSKGQTARVPLQNFIGLEMVIERSWTGPLFYCLTGGLRRGKLLQWRTAAIGFQDSPAKPSTM